MEQNSSQTLDRFSHIKKSSRKKIRPEFSGGTGGQIYFKMSQELITIKKKPYQEVGHGTQEYDLTSKLMHIDALIWTLSFFSII